MHAIWSGTINFGLVTIPVKLYSAVRAKELSFHLLHREDEGRIHNERVCSVCGKKIEWKEIARGFEYEKGTYVVVTDEDLKKAKPEATQSIDIVEFVEASDVDPDLFDAPYFLEPEKKGRHAYVLLRETLRQSKKVGIAKVVLRTRQRLAVLRPRGRALVVELLRWPDEVVPASSFDLPEEGAAPPRPAELKMANMLVDTLTTRFDPAAFRDEYTDAVLKLIEARAQHKRLPPAKAKAKEATTGDLLAALKQSLASTRGHERGHHRRKKTAA